MRRKMTFAFILLLHYIAYADPEYKGYEGWIFGGYASAERGGPKYIIPEEWIKFSLGWYR